MLKSEEFREEEFREVLRRSTELVRRGYFTGINFIKSDEPLPDESVLVHFLHDSRPHLEEIVQKIALPYQIVPRRTFYILDPRYADKEGFEEEYRGAVFYDENFNQIPLDGVLTKRRTGLTVASDELDLIIPYVSAPLPKTISAIQQADIEGPFPWVDPVIIIKTEHQIETVPGFENLRHYVNIARDREEFYTIVHDETRARALKGYLRNLCNRTPQIGNLTEHSIAFHLSQINREFLEYIVKNVRPLEPIE